MQYASAGASNWQQTDLSGTLAPGDTYLVQEAAGNGPPSGFVDLVGYGTSASCAETAPTPNLSNMTAALRKDSGAQDTDDNRADFTIGEPSSRGGGGGGGTATPLKIDEIQGSGQFSPHANEDVSTTGVVTAVKPFGTARGYFAQDPAPDADPQTRRPPRASSSSRARRHRPSRSATASRSPAAFRSSSRAGGRTICRRQSSSRRRPPSSRAGTRRRRRS